MYPKYYYYTIVCNFFFPHFSIRIFPSAFQRPSASAIRIRHPQVSDPRFTDTRTEEGRRRQTLMCDKCENNFV